MIKVFAIFVYILKGKEKKVVPEWAELTIVCSIYD
jgi:hypothetical protein